MTILKARFFIQPQNSEITPVDLEIDWPERFYGFPGKPLPSDYPARYQAVARFPGILEDGEFSVRHSTGLEALVQLMRSVRQFWKDFEKSGGKVYAAMADDENIPDLSDPLKAKDFFW